jgi:hypothetical protein
MRTICCSFLVLLLVTPVFAQDPPTITPPVQPAATPVQILDSVPEGDAKDTVLFWTSLGAHGLATYLSITSSWKKVEVNPLYAEQNGPYEGKFYLRGTITKSVIAGLTAAGEIYLVRKYPSLKRVFAYVNFSIAGVYGAQTGMNMANRTATLSIAP